jgi:4-hydroxybenzoate polyprenyltransferase
MTTIEITPGTRSQWLAFPQALRVHQWVKNLLIFVPVLLDHKLFHLPVLMKAVVAFVAFCCAASGAYVLNDLLDRKADSRHRLKRNRPFAAGTLSPSFGYTLVPLLFALAIHSRCTLARRTVHSAGVGRCGRQSRAILDLAPGLFDVPLSQLGLSQALRRTE